MSRSRHRDATLPAGGAAIRGRLGKLVRSHPLLDEARRAVRFWQAIPLQDYTHRKKARTALAVRRNTLLSYPRLATLYDLACDLAKRDIDGSFVECGVWNGGSAGMMAASADDSGLTRELWLFDSWEGLPEPADVDVTVRGTRRQRGWNLGSVETVEKLLFETLKLERMHVHLVKGWFEETIAREKENVGQIALLHLDGDWYRSIKFCLQELYDQVAVGGFVVIDDYHYWLGCRQAVDDFLEERGLDPDLEDVDGNAVYFRKPPRNAPSRGSDPAPGVRDPEAAPTRRSRSGT